MSRNHKRKGPKRSPDTLRRPVPRRKASHELTPNQREIWNLLINNLEKSHPEWHQQLELSGRLYRFIDSHVERISVRFGYGDPSSDVETKTDRAGLIWDVVRYLSDDPLFGYQRWANCPREMRKAASSERGSDIADFMPVRSDAPGTRGKLYHPVQGYSLEWDDDGLRIRTNDDHAAELLIPWHRLTAMAECAAESASNERPATNPAVDARDNGPVASRRLWKSISSLRESRIVRQIAEEACRKVRRRAIAQLQRTMDLLLSHGESEPHTIWDGICVQNQAGRSQLWGAYDRAVRSAVAKHVSELHGFERKAIWLQTPEGQCRVRSSDDDRDPSRNVSGAIVDYITEYFVYIEAYRWFNPRVRTHVERHLHR
jgi:hypothetical protein